MLRDVCLWGPTAANMAAVHMGAASATAAALSEVAISRGHFGVLCDPAGARASLFVESIIYAHAGNTVHSMLRASGFGELYVVNASVAGPADAVGYGVVVTGADAVATVQGMYHQIPGAATVGCLADDGALLRVMGSVFVAGHAALQAGSGADSRLRATGVTIHRDLGVGTGYTHDLLIENATATTTFSGFMSRDRISNVFNAEVIGNFINHETGWEGACALGELIVATDGNPLPLLDYGRAAYLTGLETGGQVTINAGRVLDVAAGHGYINDGVNPIRVAWGATQVTLGASKASEFVYVTAAGAVTHAEVEPDYAINIVLARAVTNATDVLLLTRDEVGIAHSLSRMANFFEHTIGPLAESGCGTTAHADPLKITVAGGTFWVGLSERAVAGGAAVTFTSWCHDGAGGWTAAPGATVIDDESYDNGLGLVAIPGGHFTNHTVYIAVNDGGEEYHVVYGQAEFATALEAQEGNLPAPPDVLREYCCRSASVIVEKSAGVINSIVDVRPQVGQYAATGGGVAGDHDLLLNLDHDTHLQYLTAARALVWHGLLAGAHVTGGDLHKHDGVTGGAQIAHADLGDHGATTHADLDAHVANTSDPHGATAAPGAGRIPVGDAGGTLDAWVTADAAAGTASRRKLGTGALEACAGNDARLSDPRAPTAHAASHLIGGGDPVARGAHASSTGVSTNATATPATKVSLPLGAVAAGTYRVAWSAEMNHSATNSDFIGRVLLDGATPLANWNVEVSDATSWDPVSGFLFVALTAAAHTLALQFSAEGGTASIRNAHLECERWE